MNPALVYIVILNWNGIDDTLACLDSLAALTYPNFNVIVVDNGSTDHSLDKLRAYSNPFPLMLLETGQNLGYAGGNNVGIRAALDHGTDFVFVLNNDTIVAPSLLSHLVAASLLDSQIGLLGPTNYYYSEPTVVWAVGAMLLKSPPFGYQIMGDGDKDSSWKIATQVDALVGSAMLIHKRVFEQINLFDERFFLCWEEFDFSARAREAAFKCLFVPEAKIWHKVGSSFGEVKSPLRVYFNVRNKLLWAKKHLPSHDYRCLLKLTFNEVFRFTLGDGRTKGFKRWAWALASAQRSLRLNRTDPMRRAAFLGLRDYLLRRFGDCPNEVRHLRGDR